MGIGRFPVGNGQIQRRNLAEGDVLMHILFYFIMMLGAKAPNYDTRVKVLRSALVGVQKFQ